MAENNKDNADDIDDIDALLDELSNEKLDPDLSAFDDSTDLVEKDVAFSDEVTEEPEIASEQSSAPNLDAEQSSPLEIEDASSDDSFLQEAAMMTESTAAASASAMSSDYSAAKSKDPTRDSRTREQSQFDEFEQLTGIDEMDFQSQQPVTVMLTQEQETQLKKTKMLSLLSASLMIIFSFGALVMASLAWINSGTGHLSGAIQVQHENSEQQRLLLQNISQQLSALEQKADVSRLLIDDLLNAQATNEPVGAPQRSVAVEVAPAPPVPATPPVAAPQVQVNTDALQRRIEQVQRTANTIQSRMTEINQQLEHLGVQQQTTTKAVKELEKSWLEQILAEKEQQREQEAAETSLPVAPDAYRYVAPNNHFSFP